MRSREAYGVAGAIAAPVILGSSVALSRVLTDYPLLTGQTIRYGIAAVGLWALFKLRGLPFPSLTSKRSVCSFWSH